MWFLRDGAQHILNTLLFRHNRRLKALLSICIALIMSTRSQRCLPFLRDHIGLETLIGWRILYVARE